MVRMENAHALRDSKVMVLKIVKILRNVWRGRCVNAIAKLHGAVTNARAAAACCVSGTMILASISFTAQYAFALYLYKCASYAHSVEVQVGSCLDFFNCTGFGLRSVLCCVQTQVEGKF